MYIEQDILTYVFNLISIHQPETMIGTYDGMSGDLTITFEGDDKTYVQEFEYLGVSENQFRGLLCDAAGELVKQHNIKMGIPSRQPFIDAVTE